MCNATDMHVRREWDSIARKEALCCRGDYNVIHRCVVGGKADEVRAEMVSETEYP
jgi:hypothetical protein